MIEKDSLEWKVLVRKLTLSKSKKNRDYICVKCWKVISYRHLRLSGSPHSNYIKSIFYLPNISQVNKILYRYLRILIRSLQKKERLISSLLTIKLKTVTMTLTMI